MKKLLWMGLLFASLAVQSCVSYYSAALIGHEAIEIPMDEPLAGPPRIHTAFSLKTAPTRSLLTRDRTNSIQASVLASTSVSLAPEVRFFLGLAASEYYAVTSTYPRASTAQDYDQYQDSEKYEDRDAFGSVLQIRPGFILDHPDSSDFIGLDLIYASEAGTYYNYRKGLAPNSDPFLGSVNLSPNGTTVSTYLQTMRRTRFSGNQSVDIGAGLGYGFLDWPHTGSPKIVSKVSIGYRYSNFWVWGSVESLDFLNVGLGLGLGYQLF